MFALSFRTGRWNVDAGIRSRGKNGFGALGIPVYRDQIIEDLCQIRSDARAAGVCFEVDRQGAIDACDTYTSPKTDTGERFGLGWSMNSRYDVLHNQSGSKVERFNALQKVRAPCHQHQQF